MNTFSALNVTSYSHPFPNCPSGYSLICFVLSEDLVNKIIIIDTCLISTCETLPSRYDGTRKSTTKEYTTYMYQEKAHMSCHTQLCQTDHCWVGDRKTWGRGLTLFLGTPWAQETVLGFTGLNNLNRCLIQDHAWSWHGILDKYCLGS